MVVVHDDKGGKHNRSDCDRNVGRDGMNVSHGRNSQKGNEGPNGDNTKESNQRGRLNHGKNDHDAKNGSDDRVGDDVREGKHASGDHNGLLSTNPRCQ